MIYRFADCVLDAKGHKFHRAGELIEIEPKVFEVLLYLIERQTELVTRDELLEACWPGMYISEGSMTRCITRVRSAIGHTSQHKLIETVHRRGYRFIAEVSKHADDGNDMIKPASPVPEKITTPAESKPDPSPEFIPSSPVIPSADHHPTPDINPPAASAEIDAPTDTTADPVAAPSVSESAPRPVTSAAALTLNAERRQITVLSCQHVIDHHKQSLDVEEQYQQEQEFRRLCLDCLTPLGGHLAQSLTNGFLFYFGYPQAFEDSARRAVLSALRLLEQSQPQSTDAGNSPLPAVQIGIHTGPVIVNTAYHETSQTIPVSGPSETAAIQLAQQAGAQRILISAATARLVSAWFECRPLESEAIPAVAADILPVYQVSAESEDEFPLTVDTLLKFTPFVGRDPELALLNERWIQVQEGNGQVVLISGDSGIGKSRLVERLRHHIIDSRYLRLECRCSPYHQNTAFFPLLELLRWALQEQPLTATDGALPDDSADELQRIEALVERYQMPADQAVPLLAELLSVTLPPGRYADLNLNPTQRRQYSLQLLLTLLLTQSQRQPLLLCLEDLHWADPSTLEFIELLIDQVSATALLLVLTARPEFDLPWNLRTQITLMKLDRLNHDQIRQMLWRITNGKVFPENVVQLIMEKTDGVPLFIEELTHMLLESGQLQLNGQNFELNAPLEQLAIPMTLRDSLMARLDHLASAKEVLHWGAVLGREFSHELLNAVVPFDETRLQHELKTLLAAGLLFRRGLASQIHYLFKHALVRDIAYQSLLKRQRQQLHRHVAEVLKAQFPDIAGRSPELLAHHYSAAGALEPAILAWRQAAEQAVGRSAMQEALIHFNKALELLESLPDSRERQYQELELQIALGPVLATLHGQTTTALEAAYQRADELCQQLGETDRRVPVLWGLWRFYLHQPLITTARELARQMFALAQQSGDRRHQLLANEALGSTALIEGQLVSAREHYEQGLQLYDREQHHALTSQYGGCDPGVLCISRLALILWYLGYPQQAWQRSQESLSLARNLSQPYSLAFALDYQNRLCLCLQQEATLKNNTDELISIASQQNFDILLDNGIIYRSAIAAIAGDQVMENIARIKQCLAPRTALRLQVTLPQWLYLLASVYACAGQTGAALSTLDEALAILDDMDQVSLWRSDLLILKGRLLLKQSDQQPLAESCFQQAYETAETQQAKSLQLRAATSLVRLWLEQGKAAQGWRLLAPVYDWFNEGFDTADLQAAKALLDQQRK